MDRHLLLHFVYRRAHVKSPGDRPQGAIALKSDAQNHEKLAFNSWDFPKENISEWQAGVQASIGSNAWAISGTKTESGSAMLFINPHLPWYGIGQFYETHVQSDEGLNFSGACFLGNPMPTIGHNESLGWAYTVNEPDIADSWRVTFDVPGEPLKYQYDGGHKIAEEWTETLLVKTPGTAESREQTITFRKTHHGPVVHQENETSYLTVQVAGLFDSRRVDQAWGMVMAKSFTDWKTAMNFCAIPMFNVVYADQAGNIFYAYNGSIPVRDLEFNWRLPVDGSNPRTAWKGMHSFDDLPQVLNPKSGYVQSCNSTPFTTTDNLSDNPDPQKFPHYMLEDRDVDMRRSKMSRRLLATTQNLTFPQFLDLVYDTSLYWALDELPKLKKDFEQLKTSHPALADEVAPMLEHLLDWNCQATLDSTQTTLCLAWYEELYGFGYPAETLKQEYAHNRLTWFHGLKKAGNKLKSLYGDWKHPWGKAHRIQRVANQADVKEAAVLFNRLSPSLPMTGAPGPLGIIHTVYSTPEIPLLRPERYAVVGATFSSAMEFTEPIRSSSIAPFGVSANPRSPHFFDQASIYAAKKMKPAWFQKEDVRHHAKQVIELSR